MAPDVCVEITTHVTLNNDYFNNQNTDKVLNTQHSFHFIHRIALKKPNFEFKFYINRRKHKNSN